MIQFDLIFFQMGWFNHQLAYFFCGGEGGIGWVIPLGSHDSPALGKARSAIADRDLSAATASLAEFRAAGGREC